MFSEVIGHITMILLKAICLLSFREFVSQGVKNHPVARDREQG